MSSLATGRAPRTDQEWVREIARRVRALEHRGALRAGEWVISTRASDGHLIATKPGDTLDLDAPVVDLTDVAGKDGKDGTDGSDGSNGSDGADAELPPVIPAEMLPEVPVSSVGLLDPNLLWNSHFNHEDAIAPETGWVWDGDVGHQWPGSARCDFDGTTHQMFSNKVPCDIGDVYTVGGWANWEGVSTAGPCIRFDVYALDEGGNAIDIVTLGTLGEDGGDSNPTWIELVDQYDVQTEGTTHICLVMVGTSEAIGGSAWVDDMRVIRRRLLQIDWVMDLREWLDGLFDRDRSIFDAFHGGPGGTDQDIWDRLRNIGPVPDGFLAGEGIRGRIGIDSIPTDDLTRDNIRDLGEVFDDISSAFSNQEIIGADGPLMRSALDAVMDSMTAANDALAALQGGAQGSSSSGLSLVEDFTVLPNSAEIPQWLSTYTGAGTTSLGILNGRTNWYTARDGSREVISTHPLKTLTDYQFLTASMWSLPQAGGDWLWTARVSDDHASYVYLRVREVRLFNYEAELGCLVGGVKTILKTGIRIPNAFGWRWFVGTGTHLRNYQLFVGSDLALDFTEPGEISAVGEAYRGWGQGGVTDGIHAPVQATFMGAADAQPPDVVGSGAHMVRFTATNVVNIERGTNPLPPNIFEQVIQQSLDIDCDPINGTYVVHEDAWYTVNAGVKIGGQVPLDQLGLILYRGGWPVQVGDVNYRPQQLTGHWNVYLYAGQAVSLGTYNSSTNVQRADGDPDGIWTYFNIALSNRSTA